MSLMRLLSLLHWFVTRNQKKATATLQGLCSICFSMAPKLFAREVGMSSDEQLGLHPEGHKRSVSSAVDLDRHSSGNGGISNSEIKVVKFSDTSSLSR